MKIKNLGSKALFLLLLVATSAFIFTNTEVGQAATLSELESSKVTAEYTLLEPLPCIPSQLTPCPSAVKRTVDIKEYINYIFRLAIALAAFLAVMMFTIGGFQYMTSEAMGGKDEAKGRMRNAIFGLLAALTSYIILYTIDPRLVQINANVPDIKVAHDDIFANLDIGAQAIQDRLDQIRHDSAEASVKGSAFRASAADARQKANDIDAEIEKYIQDNEIPTESEGEDSFITAKRLEAAKLRATANKADDMDKIVRYQQSTTDNYLRALNTTNIGGSGTTSINELNGQQLYVVNDPGIQAYEDAILRNYAYQVHNALNNPEDPAVKEMLAEFNSQKSFQLNSLENYSAELSVTQKVYNSQSEFERAKASAISKINSQTNADIMRTTDTELKAKYAADAKMRVDTLNSYKPTISNSSDATPIN